MNEAWNLPATLSCLKNQQWPGAIAGAGENHPAAGENHPAASENRQPEVHTWICVNQPDHWWDDPEKKPICEDNLFTLLYLKDLDIPNLHLIDRCSRGKGWTGKDHGVGMARKTLMDAIDLWCAQSAAEPLSGRSRQSAVTQTRDIILSLDADTRFGPGYLASVASLFREHPAVVGLSNPYYHELTGDDILDRAMLRYEIYMRHYAINMWRIGSPYAFTALGSAIALPLRAYRKIGGMTAKKSGEDFYLLQKLCKTGRLIHFNTETVQPATRYSDRVFFGTGPALIKGSRGDWESYPVYDYRLFDKVAATCRRFPDLFDGDVETPMDAFLQRQFCSGDVFGPLRQNAKTREQFVRACHHRIDGLRILQFLKSAQAQTPYTDEDNLKAFIDRFYKQEFEAFPTLSDGPAQPADLEQLDFSGSPIAFLNKIRNFLYQKEQSYREGDLHALRPHTGN